MDSLGAHKTRAVRDLLEQSGFAYRYLPPYSPDLNPIEHARAKVKAGLRRAAARSVGALHDAVGATLDTITARDAAPAASAMPATPASERTWSGL